MPRRRDIADFQQILRQQLPVLRERYAVAALGLFGSSIRGETRADSDLDVLVHFDKTPSLLRLIELENYLSDLLGVRVDLAMADSLKPHIGRRILQEAVPI